MKQLRLIGTTSSGRILVDEKSILTDAPTYWSKFLNKHVDDLLNHLSKYGKVSIFYVLNKETIYEHARGTKGSGRIEKGDRSGKDKSSQIGRTRIPASAPVKEKPRVILRKADPTRNRPANEGDFQRGIFD